MPPYLEGEELKKLMQEVDLLLEHWDANHMLKQNQSVTVE